MIYQSHLGFSIDNTDHIIKLVNELSPTGKFRNVDTHFRTDSKYEKKIMAAIPLTGNSLHKLEMEYNGNLDILLSGYSKFLLILELKISTQLVAWEPKLWYLLLLVSKFSIAISNI